MPNVHYVKETHKAGYTVSYKKHQFKQKLVDLDVHVLPRTDKHLYAID